MQKSLAKSAQPTNVSGVKRLLWRGFRSLAGPGLRPAALRANESGQALVLAAVCLVVLMGMLALSIDGGVLQYRKRQLQTLADAAALAAALAAPACNNVNNCAAMQSAAQNALVENGITGSTVLTQCAARSGNGIQVTVNNPPCEIATDPNAGSSPYVEAIVSAAVPTVFAKVLGISSVNLRARAEALIRPSPCVYLLSQQNTSTSSLTTSNQSLQANCAFYLGRSYALSAGSSTGSQFFVAGTSANSSGSVSPTPIYNAPLLPDPLGALAAPSVGACTYQSYNMTSSGQLQPGTYCGGLTIAPSGNGGSISVQLAAGTYIILGPLNINNATLTGNGVTFYMSQAKGYSYGTGTLSNLSATLTAPTSGSLQGILYFADRGLPAGQSGLTLSNWNPSTRLDGILYLPGQKLSAANVTLQGTQYFGVVADLCAMNNTTLLPTSNYSSLANGTPFTTVNKGAALVQ